MNFPSKIYIDGGDPQETKQADAMLKKAGYHGLDGQTTNPSLIAKNFAAKNGGKKISLNAAFEEYKRVVTQMSKVIPDGKISIQVIGDPATMTVEEMISQARDRVRWIPNSIIKMPCTKDGIAAVEVFCEEGPVNLTLNFTQDQGAAVYTATQTHNYDVFISPFVGRLDDIGENGMDVIANELAMYRKLGDGHVQIISASVRNLKHLLYSLSLKCDVVTIPFKVFKEWADPSAHSTSSGQAGSGQVPFAVPGNDFIYDVPGLTEIPYKELSLENDWKQYDIRHDLTDAGVAKFWEDWKSIVL
jgi:transaldolase